MRVFMKRWDINHPNLHWIQAIAKMWQFAEA